MTVALLIFGILFMIGGGAQRADSNPQAVQNIAILLVGFACAMAGAYLWLVGR